MADGTSLNRYVSSEERTRDRQILLSQTPAIFFGAFRNLNWFFNVSEHVFKAATLMPHVLARGLREGSMRRRTKRRKSVPSSGIRAQVRC